MEYQEIKFFVKDGKINSTEKFITADSINSLKAAFSFDENWSNLAKTAIFRKGENAYHTVLKEDVCIIPYEVITDGVIYVSVFGVSIDKRVTTTECVIEVQKSGYTVCTPTDPSLDPYNYYLYEANKISENCANDHMWAKFYSDKTKTTYDETSDIAKSISDDKYIVEQFANAAATAKNIAEEKSDLVTEVAEQLKNSVENAKSYSDDAKTYCEDAKNYALSATQTTMEVVETHNLPNSGAHKDIVSIANEAKNIARGKATSITFNTEAEMFYWLGIKNLCPLPFEGTFSSNGYEDYTIKHNSDGTFNLSIPNVTTAGNYAELTNVNLPAGTYTVSSNSDIIKLSDGKALPQTVTLEQPGVVQLMFSTEAQVSEENIYIQIEQGVNATSFKRYLESYERTDGKTPQDLISGDNLYIIELGVPDYWWDGSQVHPLGAEKPNLNDYYKKSDIDLRFGNTAFKELSNAEYEEKYSNGTLDAGTIYFVYEG